MLWIGCLESDAEFQIKASKGYNLASAQVSQKNLLLGLEEAFDSTFDSINGSVLPPYPVYKDKDVPQVFWEHKKGAYDISVGYRNYKYVNRITCRNAMIKAAEDWVSQRYNGGDLTIIVYSMRSASMGTACYIKSKIPKAKIFLIVTDLPQFMDLGESRLKSALKKFDWLSIKKMESQFDGFILYSEKMADYLGLQKDKWVLMEGSYDAHETINENSEKEKAIMYSGKLDMQYGIKMLVDAFMEIEDSSIELWLTGGGNAESYLHECAKRDNRIKFFGFLPNRSDVIKLQQKAQLLINMRLPSEKASNYCFPSKLFEYMATGIPVLSFRLGGIPKEYEEYLIYIDEESKDAVRTAIEDFFSNMKSFDSIGEKARRFVLDKKNIRFQSEIIARFIQARKAEKHI